MTIYFFFFSSRRRHTRSLRDWSSDVCSSDLCEPYFLEELRCLDRVTVVVGLGRIGWQTYLRARRRLGAPPPARAPKFAHGGLTTFADGVTLIASYHPSQQNTFTGRLTRPM